MRTQMRTITRKTYFTSLQCIENRFVCVCTIHIPLAGRVIDEAAAMQLNKCRFHRINKALSIQKIV